MRRRVDVLSSAAWALVALAVAAGVAAPLLGWVELRLLALFSVFLLLGCAVFVVGSHRLGASLALGRTRVVVGERATGRLELTNASTRRLLPLVVELPVGAGSATFEVPWLAAGARHDELFTIPTHRRAVLDLGPVRAIRTDPFRLLRREKQLTEPDLLYVHPRTVPVTGTASGFVRDLEGTTVRKVTDSDVAFHALREYVPGDDRRFVHWKSTARTGTLMVRQFEETRRSHLLVALSTRPGDYADDVELELAVSAAGSLAVQALRDGHTVSVLTSVRHLRADHATLLLDQLSGVAYDAHAPRQSEALRRLSRDVHGASVAVLVGGSVVEAGEVRGARRHLGPDVRTLALRAETGAPGSVRSMSDLTLVTLGQLDDLPASIRRAAP